MTNKSHPVAWPRVIEVHRIGYNSYTWHFEMFGQVHLGMGSKKRLYMAFDEFMLECNELPELG